jgi:hypothetical protein
MTDTTRTYRRQDGAVFRITRFDPPREMPGWGIVVGTIARDGVGIEYYTESDRNLFDREAAYREAETA